MLPSHSQRQCFKTDQVMKNAQILSVHSLIREPNVGMNNGSFEPIMAVSNLMYIVRNMLQCTLECRIWGESAHYTKGM